MKRYLYVPISFLGDNNSIPNAALDMSNSLKLPIRIGQKDEFSDIKNVEIICVPEKKNIIFDKKVESNFLQVVVFENDFVTFSKKTKCIVSGINKKFVFFPSVPEKHYVNFKFRINEIGKYSFLIENDDKIVSDEYFFEVL